MLAGNQPNLPAKRWHSHRLSLAGPLEAKGARQSSPWSWLWDEVGVDLWLFWRHDKWRTRLLFCFDVLTIRMILLLCSAPWQQRSPTMEEPRGSSPLVELGLPRQTALMLDRSTGRPASQLCPLVTTKTALYSSPRVKETAMDRVSTMLGLKNPELGRRTQYAPDGSCG
jgi:hypothetical protein